MTLDRWLREVTTYFPDDTARRIRTDLEEHALTLMERAREEGHPDPEATALAALGDAREVRAALEASHFTWAEDQVLENVRMYRRARPQALRDFVATGAALLAIPFLAVQDWSVRGFGLSNYVAFVLGGLPLMLLPGVLQRRFSARSFRLLVIPAHQLLGGYVMFALLFLWSGGRPDGFTVGLSLLVFSVVTLGAFVPLWPFLPKALRNAR